MKKGSPLQKVAFLAGAILVILGIVQRYSKGPFAQLLNSNSNPSVPHTVKLAYKVDTLTANDVMNGYDTAIVISAVDEQGSHYRLQNVQPSLYLNSPAIYASTADGIMVSTPGNEGMMGSSVWGDGTDRSINTPPPGSIPPIDSRFTFRLRRVQPGTLSFGLKAAVLPADQNTKVPTAPSTSPTPVLTQVEGKWLINRNQILNHPKIVASQNPTLKLRSVNILSAGIARGMGNGPRVQKVCGELVIDVPKGSKPQDKLSLYIDAGQTGPQAGQIMGMSWGSGATMGRTIGTPETPNTRVLQFQIELMLESKTFPLSGRVNAEGKWPLGFQVEPFQIQDLKAGQKLKFKSFPWKLPAE